MARATVNCSEAEVRVTWYHCSERGSVSWLPGVSGRKWMALPVLFLCNLYTGRSMKDSYRTGYFQDWLLPDFGADMLRISQFTPCGITLVWLFLRSAYGIMPAEIWR